MVLDHERGGARPVRNVRHGRDELIRPGDESGDDTLPHAGRAGDGRELSRQVGSVSCDRQNIVVQETAHLDTIPDVLERELPHDETAGRVTFQ